MKPNKTFNIWNKYANIWDTFSFQIYFNILHKISLKLIKEYLSNDKKILDIGCATGNFLYKIQKINKKIEMYGIDYSERMIAKAKNKFKDINFYNLKAEEINFPHNFFDIITIIETFHHLQNQKLVLEKICKILKPNGILLIAEPNLNNKITEIFINFLKKIDIEKESIFLTQEEIIKLANNFQLENFKTQKFLGNVFLMFKNRNRLINS